MKTRLLLVDDEKDFVKQLADRLVLREFDVFQAYSGKQAVEKINSALFDVVILDVAMPEMDGIETLKQIKIKAPITEIIMLTGHGTVETAIDGMKLGAFDYLKKPTDIEELVKKVNSAHSRKTEHEERIRHAKVKEIISSPRSVLKDD